MARFLFDIVSHMNMNVDTLQYLDPVILEIVPLNLEEIFTYELKEKGYSFDQVLEQEAKTDEEETV